MQSSSRALSASNLFRSALVFANSSSRVLLSYGGQTPLLGNFSWQVASVVSLAAFGSTELGYEVGPRLRELTPNGQREPGGGIHAT